MFFSFIFLSVVSVKISLPPFSSSYSIHLHLKSICYLVYLFQILHTLLSEHEAASCFHKHLIKTLKLNAYGLVRISSISWYFILLGKSYLGTWVLLNCNSSSPLRIKSLLIHVSYLAELNLNACHGPQCR